MCFLGNSIMPQTSKLVFPPTFNSLSPMKSPFSGHFVKVFPHENLKLIISKNVGWVTLFMSFLKKGEIDDFYQDNFFQTPKKNVFKDTAKLISPAF